MNYTNYEGKVQKRNKHTFGSSLCGGFTLVEVLTAVVIIAVLVSIALPMYTRSIERARAAEAMSAIKAINDSVYTFFAEHEACPTRFSQLAATLPVGNAQTDTDTRISTKFFQFDLGGAAVPVPGTDGQCNGLLATRINGGSYAYTIWNPYTRGTTGKSLALQCAPVTTGDSKNIALCESLGLYRP